MTLAECSQCHRIFDINELDAKPTMTPTLRDFKRRHGQRHMLSYAAKYGYDFDKLECADCYGPGYESN